MPLQYCQHNAGYRILANTAQMCSEDGVSAQLSPF